MPKGQPHNPTAETRAAVHVMTAGGVAQKAIAEILGISVRALRMHYGRDMRYGRNVATAKVIQSLFKKAVAGDTAAMIFWLRNRDGTNWEHANRQTIQLGGYDGGPIQYEDARERVHRKLEMMAIGLKAIPGGKDEGGGNE
jgi:hypothetical protein